MRIEERDGKFYLFINVREALTLITGMLALSIVDLKEINPLSGRKIKRLLKSYIAQRTNCHPNDVIVILSPLVGIWRMR